MTAVEEYRRGCYQMPWELKQQADAAIAELAAALADGRRREWALDRAREEDAIDHAGDVRHANALTKRAEAELDVLKTNSLNWGTLMHELMDERDALRDRRCDECASREGQSHYCLLLSINTADAFYCSDWQPREGGEG